MTNSTTEYTGWTIRHGFLDGDLGDGADRAAAYAACLEEALARAYPGAAIEVPWQRNTQGTTPVPLRTAATNAAGADVTDAERDQIDGIADRVFTAGTWLDEG
jgi:hypothetical protein